MLNNKNDQNIDHENIRDVCEYKKAPNVWMSKIKNDQNIFLFSFKKERTHQKWFIMICMINYKSKIR